MKTQKKLEDFIRLTRDLASENNLDKLLGEIIHESLGITHAEGGKIYLPDITKQFFYLRYVGFYRSETCNNKGNYEVINIDHPILDAENSVSRVELHDNCAVNSNNYLVFSAITGKMLELDRQSHFSSYDIKQAHEFDQGFHCTTNNILVLPLCNHQGITIGLLELYNYSGEFDKGLLNAFTSLSAVLINNANLVSQNNHLIRVLDETNQKLEQENNRLKKNIKKNGQYEIIGESQAIKSVLALLDRISDSNVTVLLRGETGTGKEVFARAIHNNSRRKNEVFVSQNCAALPEDLLESELFGYLKGAFTGAVQDKQGLFELADGGTLFLDEIGDMPINLQAKVLRVIQEQEVRPLGSIKTRKVDVRIIAATHCDLEHRIKNGSFRQDLFYRLNIFPVMLPKLSERENDILLLLHYFVKQYNRQYERNIDTISPRVMDCLSHYNYPGNVRELQNIIERAVLLCHDSSVLLEEHLPLEIVQYKAPDSNRCAHSIPSVITTSLKDNVQKYEADLIKTNLKANNWNQTITAQMLKMPRRTLVEKISRLNIKIPKRNMQLDMQ